MSAAPVVTPAEREFCRRMAAYQIAALALPESERDAFLAGAAARVWTEIEIARGAHE